MQRHRAYNLDEENNVYHKKVKNLVGIFGALIIANTFSWIPYFVAIFYSLIGEKVNDIPIQIDVTLFVVSLSNTAANPIVQIYFRMDLRDTLRKMFRKSKKNTIVQRNTVKEYIAKNKNMEEVSTANNSNLSCDCGHSVQPTNSVQCYTDIEGQPKIVPAKSSLQGEATIESGNGIASGALAFL